LDPKLFAKTARYKIPKQGKPGNVSVISLYKRMTEIAKNNPQLGIKLPLPGDRFKYVISKHSPHSFNQLGVRVNTKAGDKYELFDLIQNEEYNDKINRIEVDVDYYIENEILGQFTRLISYHEKFNTSEKKEDLTQDEYKANDKSAMRLAKSYLREKINITKPYVDSSQNKILLTKRKEISSNIISNIKSKNAVFGDILKMNSSLIINSSEKFGNVKTSKSVLDKIYDSVIKFCIGKSSRSYMSRKYVISKISLSRYGDYIGKNSTATNRMRVLSTQECEAKLRIKKQINDSIDLFKSYTEVLYDGLNGSDKVFEIDDVIMKSMMKLCYRLIGILSSRKNIEFIIDVLKYEFSVKHKIDYMPSGMREVEMKYLDIIGK
jgi:hypothetical protein